MHGLEEPLLWTWMVASALAQQAELAVHYPFDGSNEDEVAGDLALFDGSVTYGFGPLGDAVGVTGTGVVDRCEGDDASGDSDNDDRNARVHP
jgi:hypothetical protein